MDSDYTDAINDIIERETEQKNAPTIKQRWELIKLEVTNFSVEFSKKKQKSKRLKLEVLEKKLKRLHEELQTKSPTDFKDTEEQIRLVKHEIANLMKEKTNSAILRARANWAKHSDLPTKYFLNLEKCNYHKKTLYRIMTPDGKVINDEKLILNELRTFYKKLYTSTGVVDFSYLDQLHNIPKIPQDIRDQLDQQPTVQEIEETLADFKNNKCPGTDGLSANFLKFFWPKLKDFIHSLFQEIKKTGEFHLTARRSIISLLEKMGKMIYC